MRDQSAGLVLAGVGFPILLGPAKAKQDFRDGAIAFASQAGVERAQEANTSIKQIGEGSRNAVSMVEEITAAIREQGSATNSIANQVDRMAHMAEESSAAAGLSAEAAKKLDQLAADMQRIVSRYKL